MERDSVYGIGKSLPHSRAPLMVDFTSCVELPQECTVKMDSEHLTDTSMCVLEYVVDIPDKYIGVHCLTIVLNFRSYMIATAQHHSYKQNPYYGRRLLPSLVAWARNNLRQTGCEFVGDKPSLLTVWCQNPSK